VQPSAVPAPLTPPPVQSRAPGTLQKTKEQWKKEGDTHYNAKRYQRALAAYEQAIRLDPDDAGAYYNKGIILEKLGEKREAKRAYERARQLGYNG
jgi:Flp pilus assembly protein TadD